MARDRSVWQVVGVVADIKLDELEGVSPTDVFTLVTASAFLTRVALVSCYVAARWAAKVDPIEALRYN